MCNFTGVRNLAVAMLILTLLVSEPVYGGVLTIQEKHRVQEGEKISSVSAKGLVSPVSQRNLLGLSRRSPLSLPDISLSAAEAKSIRICAIRVEFQYEEPDDPRTTGRGRFDMRSQDEFRMQERHEIDMSPHNRSYFESHLRALSEYWKVVSQDKISLTYDVFPRPQDSVYTLSNKMGHYGDTARSVLEGLGEFFVESFSIADNDTAIHFADYDAFVVFHAGSDKQNDIGYPSTPFDLYTGFIMLAHPCVVDDSVLIWDGIMMPETGCQDNRVIALNGVFAHEFGHQLGLVDLYDTRTWMTQVGDFSLHDNQGRGTAADLGFERSRLVTDVLPVFPDAWSRAYLGFVDVHEVSDVRNQEVWAAELKTDRPQVLKVPITDHEYFLIENRQVDSDRDGGTQLRVDSLTGVILGPAPADSTDERYLTRDYDYFLPGSGILIWHVDETRAYLDYDRRNNNNFLDNHLQWYNYYPCRLVNQPGLCLDSIQWENRRFLSVVEADGIVDFGGYYRTGFGRQEDYFYLGNNRVFGPTTNPSSRSNSGAYTGIWIYDVSGIATIMTVSVEFESGVVGLPQFVNNSRFPPVLADVDADGRDEIFIAGKNHIVAMKADGSHIIRPLPGREILDSTFVLCSDTARGGLGDVVAPDGSIIKGGTYVVDTLRAIASIDKGNSFATTPLVVDLDGDGVFEIVAGTNSGMLCIWRIEDRDADGRADSVWFDDEEFGEPFRSGPVALRVGDGNLSIFAGTETGMVAWEDIGEDGPRLRSSVNPGRVCGISADDNSDEVYYVACSAAPSGAQSAKVMRWSDGTALHELDDAEVTGFTAADLDAENGTDFALLTADGRLVVLLSQSPSMDMYAAKEIRVADSLAGGVITAALDPLVPCYQIIFAGDNRLHVFNHNGTEFDNFPQLLDIHRPAGLVGTTPIVADADGDGRPDIIVGTDAGEIFAIGHDGVPLEKFPRVAGSQACRSFAVSAGTAANNWSGKLFAVSDDNRIHGHSIGSRKLLDEQSWVQSGRSAIHQNFRGTSTVDTPARIPGGLIVDFYNYPNPASDETTIRYRLATDGEVSIRIYDLSGRLVYEDRDIGSNTHMHYVWNLDGYPSGVYICRLEAFSGGSSETATHKIAVVK